MIRIISLGWAVFAALCFTSCNKDSTAEYGNHPTIHGKWNLVNDSKFTWVGINNQLVNYTGQTGDYFDFRTDGNLYIKEGVMLDTLHYALQSDSTIFIASFGSTLNGVPEKSYLTNLTAYEATINAPAVITPGGEFGGW